MESLDKYVNKGCAKAQYMLEKFVCDRTIYIQGQDYRLGCAELLINIQDKFYLKIIIKDKDNSYLELIKDERAERHQILYRKLGAYTNNNSQWHEIGYKSLYLNYKANEQVIDLYLIYYSLLDCSNDNGSYAQLGDKINFVKIDFNKWTYHEKWMRDFKEEKIIFEEIKSFNAI